MSRLEELAIKFGSDKYYSHSYVPFYEKLFEGRTVRRLLEIGIGFRALMAPFTPKFVPGSSLYMWQEYFENAEIFAIDIRPETMINEGRIRTFICDQFDVESLTEIALKYGPFDVIIDDGSHQTEHQIITARTLLPFINAGGVYLIEDVREPDTVTRALMETSVWTGYTIHRWIKRPDDCIVEINL